MIRPLRVVGATLLVAALLSGCGAEEKMAEKTTEKILSQDGSDVDIDGEKVTVKDKDGNAMSFGEGVELPDDFPADIPLPQGDYKISSVISQGEGMNMMLALEDPDIKSVEEHLKSSFIAAGYTVEEGLRMENEGGKQVHLTAKSAVREVSVILGVTSDQATAMYMLKKAEG